MSTGYNLTIKMYLTVTIFCFFRIKNSSSCEIEKDVFYRIKVDWLKLCFWNSVWLHNTHKIEEEFVSIAVRQQFFMDQQLSNMLKNECTINDNVKMDE